MKDSLEINKPKYCRTCYSHAYQAYAYLRIWGNSWIQNILWWNLSLVAITLASGAFQRLVKKNHGLDCCKVHNLIGGRLLEGAAQLKLHCCIWIRSNVLYRRGLRQGYAKWVGCSAVRNPRDSLQVCWAQRSPGAERQRCSERSTAASPLGAARSAFISCSTASPFTPLLWPSNQWQQNPGAESFSSKEKHKDNRLAARRDEGSKTNSTSHQIDQRKRQLLLKAQLQ